MQRRHVVNGASGERQRFAPIQLMNRTDAAGSEQAGDSGRNDELALSTIGQPAQSEEIQMIVVIVADKHYIDTGKILPPYARQAPAARAHPGKRTRPRRPDRIGQNVASALLEQQCGMIDQCNPQLIAFHCRRRLAWLNVRNEAGGWFPPAGELPSQGIEKAARLSRVRIEVALPVKMHRKRR